MKVFKIIINVIGRLIQLAVLAFFCYWQVVKYTGTDLEFAMLTLILVPYMIPALLVGTVISIVYHNINENIVLTVIDSLLMLLYIILDTYTIVSILIAM